MDFSFYFDLPLWIRTALQGIAVIAVLFPISAACSMAERKVAAWVQGRPGPNRAIVHGSHRFPSSVVSCSASACFSSWLTAASLCSRRT